VNLYEASNFDLEEAAQDWRDTRFADYLNQIDHEPDTKIFDEKSSMVDIVWEMSMERKVSFCASWQVYPQIYSVTDVIVDRLEWGSDEDRLAIAQCFGLAMYNQEKGVKAVEIAQAVDMHIWVSSFFKILQENVPTYLRVSE